MELNGKIDIYLRWIVGGVLTVCLGLSSILWNQNIAQIAELRAEVITLNTQVSDLKGDARLLNAKQQEISDKLSEISGSLSAAKRR
jgi:cell division protein FtsB